MRLEIDDEVVRAARAYTRGRTALRLSPTNRKAQTELDLAAHAFAEALADRVLDADADAFLDDVAEASEAMRTELHP